MSDEPLSPQGPHHGTKAPLPDALARLRPGDQGSSVPGAGRYAGLGLQFAGSLLLFLYIGQWLDRRFGTNPFFLYVGVATGAGAAFFSMYRSLMADQRREELERTAGRKP